MNSNGDNHVSFSALDINISPDGKYILVTTGLFRCSCALLRINFSIDRDRLILYKIGASDHVCITLHCPHCLYFTYFIL